MSMLGIVSLADLSILVCFFSYVVLDIDANNHFIRIYATKLVVSLIFIIYVFVRIVYINIVFPAYVDPLTGVPQAPQEALSQRFFTEPEASQLEAWLNTIPNNGLIRYHGRLNETRLLVTSPAGCEEVLQTKAALFPKQPATRKILKMWLGTDTLLCTTSGDGHKSLKKRLLPAFYSRKIKELQPVFWAKALQMCEALHKVVAYNNNRVLEVNMDDLIDRAALDVVGLAGHGVDFDTLSSPGGRLAKLHKSAFDLGKQELQVVLSAILLPDWIFDRLPFKVYRDNRIGVKALRAHCRDVIGDETVTKKTEEKNIVVMASRMGQFSTDELVDLSMDLLVAGHKTVSSALQLTFYKLAQYPEIQTSLREKIQQAYPDISSGVLPDVSADMKLPYLDAVQNEMLRLYPPLASMTRVTLSPTDICGVNIPAGTRVVVAQWAVNRSHAQWGADAAEFRPERWLEEEARPHLLTFSRGPRNCIGEGFARKELAVLVSAIVGRFELSIVGGDEEEGGTVRGVQQGITIKVKGGCRVGIKEIKKP